jgi:hypothetical protein
VVKAAAREHMRCHAGKIIHVKKCPIKILSIINSSFQTITSFTTYKELKAINHKLIILLFITSHQGQWGFKRRQKDAQ